VVHPTGRGDLPPRPWPRRGGLRRRGRGPRGFDADARFKDVGADRLLGWGRQIGWQASLIGATNACSTTRPPARSSRTKGNENQFFTGVLAGYQF